MMIKQATMKYADLLNKYNVPVPRYTSYPTVPFWKENISVPQWIEAFKDQFSNTNRNQGLSIYVHLPFCESLCTYCGCNKKITTNHKVETEYMDALLAEWEMYKELMDEHPLVRELHIGGGTPTFFSPENLGKLLEGILGSSIIHPSADFSFEGHPNNTSREHLQTLFNWGFRRVSFGVQDNDPVVQKAINRNQPVENVKRVTDIAREIGYKSVNYDLIYGLPFQTIDSIRKTVLDCIALKPDRFAFYSYAHVPWTSRGQRLFGDRDLPSAEEKMAFYQEGIKIFTEGQYRPIGMDHFVLATDDLFRAWQDGSLHRNFMGYTTQHTNLQLGLGVSAISDISHAFAQNNKSLHDYYSMISANKLPVARGYFLNKQDESFRKYILNISCQGKTCFRDEDNEALQFYSLPELRQLELDGLVILNIRSVEVTESGKNFIRNICKAFDLHLLKKSATDGLKAYSLAI
jgi:oxygen-independent coproporphyrinogen III oxidase